MANWRRKKHVWPTLDDCEAAIDFLEDIENYDSDDTYVPRSLKVRVHDYPHGSGRYFLLLTWYGSEKPEAGQIPIPPGWQLDGKWFFAEKETQYGNMPVWQVALLFEGVQA